MKRTPLAPFVLLFLAIISTAHAAEVGLKDGDNVAICGDSITEQKLYSIFIEDYLVMCQPAKDLRAAQFGWSGEATGGFAKRMNNDVIWYKPAVATTCYGMNDGGYKPPMPDKQQYYRDNLRAIVKNFKQGGVRLIVVGSPGCVDSQTFQKNPANAVWYNQTLAGLRDVAREVAKEEGVAFADVFEPMHSAMEKAKAKFGKDYHVAGPDGIHPAANGHLIMAYAFLKAMGCDGNIGTITFDCAADSAEATEGHKVLGVKAGRIEVESTRYPFCFFDQRADKDSANPNSTTGILQFFPFNEDLNRFKLVVKNAPSQRLKVTWGPQTKEFSADQLASGINLAAEFLDSPFKRPFEKVQNAIRNKQNFETPLNKDLMNSLATWKALLPDAAQAADQLGAQAEKRHKELADAIPPALAPVKHNITVEPVR